MTQNLPAVMSLSDLEKMAVAFAKSGMFGAKTPEQAMALLLLAQGEGLHPAIAMRDFDVIQGRPAKKAEAMLRSFLAAGGSVEWHTLTDDLADATFKHETGGSARLTWDMKRADKAGLGGRDMYRKYPRAMLRSRTVSEGCRTVYPAATSGLHVPEEVEYFRDHEKDITPAAGALKALPIATQEIVLQTSAEVKGLLANDQIADAYALWQNSNFDNDQKVAFWSTLDSKQKGVLGRMDEAERAQAKGTISEPQKKRLEARIKELALDRDEVKAYCMKEFGVNHFQELTREQYEALDKELVTINAAAPAQPTSALPSEAPEPAATKHITDAQEGEIIDLLEANGISLKTFLTFAKLTSLRQLTTERIDGAKSWIAKHKTTK